jgi:hypothetical protein
MPVTVLDRDGRFIPGLTQRDFQIFENGRAAESRVFSAGRTAFHRRSDA